MEIITPHQEHLEAYRAHTETVRPVPEFKPAVTTADELQDLRNKISILDARLSALENVAPAEPPSGPAPVEQSDI